MPRGLQATAGVSRAAQQDSQREVVGRPKKKKGTLLEAPGFVRDIWKLRKNVGPKKKRGITVPWRGEEKESERPKPKEPRRKNPGS